MLRIFVANSYSVTHPKEEEGGHRGTAPTANLGGYRRTVYKCDGKRSQHGQDLRPATKKTRFFTDIKGLNQIFG